MLRFFWDFLVVLNALVWIMALVLQGYIQPSFAAFALLLIVIILVLGKSLGGNVGRLVRFLFRIGLPLATLATFLVIFSGGSFREIMAMLGGIITLCLVLAGFYIMFYGLFSSRKHK